VLYAVHPDLWGRGYATELARAAVERARELALTELVGFTLTTNLASQRVLQKAGLRFERTIEHARLPHWFGRLALGEPGAAGSRA
jgi:ribosomal-protein-alanine N-acetyltransferase